MGIIRMTKQMKERRKLLQAYLLDHEIEEERKEHRKNLYVMDQFGNVIGKAHDEDDD